MSVVTNMNESCHTYECVADCIAWQFTRTRTHTHMHAHTHARTHTHTHARKNHTRARIHTHMHTLTHTRARTHAHTHTGCIAAPNRATTACRFYSVPVQLQKSPVYPQKSPEYPPKEPHNRVLQMEQRPNGSSLLFGAGISAKEP